MMKRTFAIVASALAISALLFASTAAEAGSSNGGWYMGGIGSSHKGGRYLSPNTGNHYRHRR